MLRYMPPDEKQKFVKEFYDRFHQIQLEYYEFWKKNTFLQWDFWLSIVLTVLPWIIWSKLHQNEKRYRLLFAGFFVIIISSLLDFLGVALGAWYYSGKGIPTVPTYIPWDFTLMPVTIMAFIEIKSKTSPLIKGIIFGLITTFIGEKVLIWLDLYQPIKWNSFYSLPIYIAIYLMAHWLYNRNFYDNSK